MLMSCWDKTSVKFFMSNTKRKDKLFIIFPQGRKKILNYIKDTQTYHA